MSSIARSKPVADSQIQRIRTEIGFNSQEGKKLPLMLERALERLSKDLYQRPSHFLLELIQNADDNTFSPDVIPSLSLTLSDSGFRYLRTDCNEVGFTFENIEAICDIGFSSKKSVSRGQRGYIGEKGIGFKSVFNAANVVNIASGYYEFKFDRNQVLGMVLPILSPFPSGHRLLNHTQFLLQLANEGVYDRVRADLFKIDPHLLIFLRKVRRLSIQTDHIKRAYHVQSGTPDASLGEIISIVSNHETEGMLVKTRHIVLRHMARGMPPVTHREGVTKSEVILVFPVDESYCAKIGPQKAYAFLPIDDFGFRFLIHADFLLVASREGLDYESSWNYALRDALRDTFISAMKMFAAVPANHSAARLRYTWPKYIRHHRSSHDFWNQLNMDILRDLRHEHIIETRDPSAGRHKPNELRFVPAKFRFEGDALFNNPSLQRQHLSFQYDGVYGDLEPLGVQRTSILDLCDELSAWIAELGVSALGSQPHEWHRKVASIFHGEEALKDRLMSLPIIPLRDGSWVCARKEHLYLEQGTRDEYVPNQINVSIIDRAASEDPERRRFYEFLGIPTYDPRQVCNLILELHIGNTSSVRDRMPEDLVRDAVYLFRHRDLFVQEGVPEIYFLVTNQGLCYRRKTQIYIVDHTAKPSLVDKYRNAPNSPFYVLDELYRSVVYGDDQIVPETFYRWLLKSPNISTVPILVRDHYPTPEWAFLRDTEITDLLLVLEQLCKIGAPHARLLQAVPELRVRCRTGLHRPLAELAIPTDDLLRACPHLDFADLPNPERWVFLAKFGIPTAPNTTARLRELDALASLPVELVDKDVVHACYRGLSLSPDVEKHEILDAFTSKPLVFIVRPHPEWVTHDSYVWSAPMPLKLVTRLATRYGDCHTLFCRHLGVGSASIEHVADELCSLYLGDSQGIVQRCEELLLILKRYLTHDTELTARHFLRIRHARVFPVSEVGDSSNSGEPRVVLRALQGADWFIPDRITLEATFRGKVNLLEFSVRSVVLLEFLWSKLGCQHLYLSSAVRETVTPRGSEIRDLCREHELQTRIKYVSCLDMSPDAKPNQYPPLLVWSVPSVVTVRSLGLIVIEEDDALITIQESSNATSIYLRTSTSQSKEAEVIFALANFFSRRYDVSSDDTNLLNLLLSAPIQDLAKIIAENNRFLLNDDRANHGPDEMDLIEQQRSERAHSSADFPDIQTQYSLRKLIPSFQSRYQRIATTAREFRVSKRPGQRSPVRVQAISGMLRHSLSAVRPSIPCIPSLPTQELVPHSSAETDENHRSPPELSFRSTAQQIRTREIGSLGEVFVHKLLERHIDDWSFNNWTSRLRAENGHPPFCLPERDYTDFTYLDHSHHMRAFLQDAGLEIDAEWSSSTTYHLEVKTTVGDCSDVFFASQNQVNMMQRFNSGHDNAYILVRVFNIDGDSPGLKFYPSPWGLYLQGILEFVSTGGYQVREGRLSGSESGS
ncbi:hypothetical protein EDB81DRAFT_899719 [Dactylonectria macrodidyma]|uniref:Protein NO VEIN C-terminal domain-containing protein n=1 Tax=Dactylonectria macrodidyma TaxID=307937 RepID=A0A9P9ERZ7_9HYPO|nr:hypothetical protein EDB81DRAFT_899719 [Dactylonectria macrodidyma]